MSSTATESQAGRAKKRSEKGHKAYNPRESFALSVTWILRNADVAEGMLRDGLQPCANATKRDTPCVPLYFFRKAYDQTLAGEYSQTIKTMADHPHYTKVYKSMTLGIPMEFNKSKLSAAGIDQAPLEWDPASPFDEERKTKLGFAPVVMSFTELYLDSRSFFEHADSPDYLAAYGVIMEGHRSLKATSRCLGTPSDFIYTTVLEPYLQVELLKTSSVRFDKNHSGLASSDVTFLEFSVIGLIEDVKDKIDGLLSKLDASCSLVFQDNSQVRVEAAFVSTRDFSPLNDIQVHAGQMFLFSSESNSGQRPTGLPSCINFFHGDPLSLFQKQGDSFWAGYCVHPLASELIADETVQYKRE